MRSLRIEAAAADTAAKGEGRLFSMTRYTAAVLYNGLGRYTEALEAHVNAANTKI